MAKNDYRDFCETLKASRDAMEHHGIKGQKWGIRRFQNSNGSLTQAGRERYGYGDAKKTKEEKKAEKRHNKERDKIIAKLQDSFEFDKEYTINDTLVQKSIELTKEWNAKRSYDTRGGEGVAKATLAGAMAAHVGISAGLGASVGGAAGAAALGGGTAAVHGVVFAGYSTVAAVANHKLKKTVEEISNNTKVDKKTGLKLKNKEMTPDEDMKMVNPGFHNWSDNTKNNCMLCTTTYALRRKGFDVTAPGASDGYDNTATLGAFKGATMKIVKNPKSFVFNKKAQDEFVEKMGIPDGGYGNLCVLWRGQASGHSMVYSVEGGKPVIRDCQTNTTYKGMACNKILRNAQDKLTITRLDNATPDVKFMKEWGMVSSAGQNFTLKSDSRKTPESSGETHGTTGLLRRYKYWALDGMTWKQAKERDKDVQYNKQIQKDNKKVYDSLEDKTLDGASRGFSEPIKLKTTWAFKSGEKTADYHTAMSKNGKTIDVMVTTDAASNDSNRSTLDRNLKVAKQIASSKTITSDASKHFAKTAKTYDGITSSADIKAIAKSMGLTGIGIARDGKDGIVSFWAKDASGNRRYVECEFTMGKNGKVIPMRTDIVYDD